jgi:hypothetical protein
MGKKIILKINLIHIDATSKKSLRKDYYRLNDIKRLLLFELHRKKLELRRKKLTLEKAYYSLNCNKSSSKSTTTKALGKAYYRSSQRIVQKAVLPYSLNCNKSSSKSTTTKALGKAYYRSSQRIVQKTVLPSD